MTERPWNSIATPLQTRRDFISALALAGGAMTFGAPGAALALDQRSATGSAADLAARAHDWDWLVGNWDVWHRRLKERLAKNNEWQEFTGKSALWLALGGLGTIDDNIVDLPAGSYRGLTLRTFDPVAGRWSIWWLDGRYPTRIDPPVLGGFEGDVGTFLGKDTFKGRPVTVRFRWLDIHGSRPNWEQSLSTDGGKTWEVNWRNYFTRTSPTATPLPRIESRAAEQHDWDFLVGRWKVHNRRLKQRLAGSTQWEEFDSTLANWPMLGGWGNVGDNLFEFPGGAARGVSLRAFDPETRQWSSWWVDGRTPSVISTPTRGSFAKGVGTLIGDDTFNGKPIKVRSQWSRMTGTSAHWEQASSADGGATWETNWVSEFIRAG